MAEIISMGEALVEIMREKIGAGLDRPETFIGPFPSGAPAIFAGCAARLGGEVLYVGTVGKDDFGKVISERLEEDGVDLTCLVASENATTGVAFVAYFEDGSRKFLYHIRDAASGVIEPDRLSPAAFREGGFLHINGSALSINPSWQETIYRAIEEATRCGMKVSFDPNLRPEILGADKVRELCQPVLDTVHIVFPSGEEAAMLTGEENADQAVRVLLQKGARIVVLKRGVEGCSIYTREESIDVPAFRVEEVDPTGAGDCFDGAFLVGLLRGLALKECGQFANAVGALAVTQKGPMEGAPFLDEAIKLAHLGERAQRLLRKNT